MALPKSIKINKKSHTKRCGSFLVDPNGIEPSTLRMRTVRSRKVVSFLPSDCGVWSAKIDYNAFAGEKYFGGFSN